MLAGRNALERRLFRVSIQLFITVVITSGCSAFGPEKQDASATGVDTTTPETTVPSLDAGVRLARRR